MTERQGGVFDKADVFHLFDGPSSSSSASAHAEGSVPITAAQYAALLHMMAAHLHLTPEAAEHLFPCSTANKPEPPLCAHLSREGVGAYWADATANTIPDVRCCDAREMDRRDPFPAAGHGPHVHCLYCFHAAVEEAPPAGRGVPPPVVADFRDAASLQAHHREHRDRYHTYLTLLDASCEGWSDDAVAADMLSDEGVAACEAAAEQAGRHGCYMASMGTSACPIVVFYCIECDCFAPVVRFRENSRVDGSRQKEGGAADEASMESAEELNVILSRLLLCCHLLYMLDATRFTSQQQQRHHHGKAGVLQRPRHVIFMFKPILFHEGVEEEVIEAYEDGAECTHAAVVLPYASVAGTPAELLLLLPTPPSAQDSAAETDDMTHAGAVTGAPPHTYAPAVVGFGMEWPSAAVMQEKIDLVLAHHRNDSANSAPVTPFQVTTRIVYIEDTEEWVAARVLYHRAVHTPAELPCSYADVAEEGIRVEKAYRIDAPMPAGAAMPASVSLSSSLSTVNSPCVENKAEGMAHGGADNDDDEDEDAVEDDATAVDGCPYSMESRTIDFFARMTALAKAMHELAAWRLTIDENKESAS